jgi:hypothetical protein
MAAYITLLHPITTFRQLKMGNFQIEKRPITKCICGLTQTQNIFANEFRKLMDLANTCVENMKDMNNHPEKHECICCGVFL